MYAPLQLDLAVHLQCTANIPSPNAVLRPCCNTVRLVDRLPSTFTAERWVHPPAPSAAAQGLGCHSSVYPQFSWHAHSGLRELSSEQRLKAQAPALPRGRT